jgi:release factor glutamine methyltransferase
VTDPSDRGGPVDGEAGTVTWRELLDETAARLAGVLDDPQAAVREARWIIGEVTGLEGGELQLGLGELATQRKVARLDSLVARRAAGEPIQLVLGHWPFRTLDLLVDQRALIPRPETEQVVEVALRALDEVAAARPAGQRPVVVDLGTGTGAIALSVAAERPKAEVWATDASADALAVARANLAGLGMAGSRVRLLAGDWWAALPADLAGTVDLVVSNPPYIGAAEELPASVVDWEPQAALVAGPSGMEGYERIIGEVARWLAPGGALVLEIGATQAGAVVALAEMAGLVDVSVATDLAGLDRSVSARRA